MAAECKVFAHSVGDGSWLKYKFVKDVWIGRVFLVTGDKVHFPRSWRETRCVFSILMKIRCIFLVTNSINFDVRLARAWLASVSQPFTSDL